MGSDHLTRDRRALSSPNQTRVAKDRVGLSRGHPKLKGAREKALKRHKRTFRL